MIATGRSGPLCLISFFFLPTRPPPTSTLFPYTTLFRSRRRERFPNRGCSGPGSYRPRLRPRSRSRSEEHTSELQSHVNLVCRLLLEKKKKKKFKFPTNPKRKIA